MEYEPREGVDYIINLYDLADVEPDADEKDIKTALNEKIKEYHPDVLAQAAEEFREKGGRIAGLLNRARSILLDPEKRKEYDDILNSWDGPISTDGTPIISLERYQEAQFAGKSPAEVEIHFATMRGQIEAMAGYNPGLLAYLEKQIQESEEVTPELRAQYENALLQRDRALAIEEAERSRILGLADIGEHKFEATLEYGGDTAQRLEQAKEAKLDYLQRLALGETATRLALLSGSESNLAVLDSAGIELPAYYEPQAEKVQQIANERQEIVEKRLINYTPEFPEEDLQAEFREDLLLGVVSADSDEIRAWLNVKVDKETNNADAQEMDDALRTQLNDGRFKDVITNGYNVMLVKSLEQVDLHDVIGVAIAKYTEKYKTED